MDNIELILKDNRNFKNLKANINNIIKYLNSAIENLDTPSNKISSYYNIDGVSVDKGKLSEIKEELTKKRNYLKNIVLVELNKKINSLDKSIEGMWKYG